MRLTGERPIAGRTPESLLALHAAGYREVTNHLGPGVVVDIGCGLGDGTVTLAQSDRWVLGVDRDPATAVEAARAHGGVTIVCGDATTLPVAPATADWVCSSHLIEHFVAPEVHVVEIARVLRADGAAFVLTPNAPADFENPYHVHLFEPPELAALLGRHFEDVDIRGLDGDAVVKADFERRRRWARRILRLDVFGLRHRLPVRWYVALHALGRAAAYPLLRVAQCRRGRPEPITAARFTVTPAIEPTTLVLFAIARHPRICVADLRFASAGS
jgi:SAM-dependent methyltransferase